ncbi:MAG: hypothetical protein V4633_02225 [Pseudomonadota bacterium]
MMIPILKALVLNEVRLRMRRVSTLVVLMAVVVISWAMIADPATGSALITTGDTRVLYTSSALAVGSASLGCLLFGLGGFYLVRGRIAEDIRSGTGSVIGATPVSNALFLAGRWAGGVAYLGSMMLVFMFTIMALHAVRGDGPIQPHIYLQNYIMLLLPMMFFCVSCAILFDSYAPLMGKGGDVLFFFVWVVQLLIVVPVIEAPKAMALLDFFDFNGMGASMQVVTASLGTHNVSLGGGDFKASIAPVAMPDYLWSVMAGFKRMIAATLALLPLLPAIFLFHRFSPDKVKLSRATKRRSPIEVLNGFLRPLSRLVSPLFRIAAALPGMAGQVVGDVALTLVASPSAILALLVAVAAGMFAESAALGFVMLGCVAFWGVLVSSVTSRDFEAGTDAMTGAVRGGIRARFVRQYAATVVVGLLFTGAVMLRWVPEHPERALSALVGILSLSALAGTFGRTSRTSRLFLSLFLFMLYIAVNAPKLAFVDVAGFSGAATMATTAIWMSIGLAALAGGYLFNRRAA